MCGVHSDEAQAFADVRTLDDSGYRWAIVDYRGPEGDPMTRYRCEVGTQAAFEGASPNEARAKAAAWVREHGFSALGKANSRMMGV